MADYGSTTLALFETRSVVLDANGAGTITNIGPVKNWESWNVVAIQTSGNSTLSPSLTIAREFGAVVATTYSGNGDTNDSPFTLLAGNSLTFKYSAGTPGAIMTATVRGDLLLRGKHAY